MNAVLWWSPGVGWVEVAFGGQNVSTGQGGGFLGVWWRPGGASGGAKGCQAGAKGRFATEDSCSACPALGLKAFSDGSSKQTSPSVHPKSVPVLEAFCRWWRSLSSQKHNPCEASF